ncbi:BACON domain-containing protein [Kitasatospora sp. NPDC004240]
MTTSADGSRDHDAVLAAYDRQVDGLFTYCLSVLCEHDAATAALREARELAGRHGPRLAEPGLLRAWLYSLARYCCLRRLAAGPPAAPPEPSPAEAARRRRELASLAWPEAAGTGPEQREALELAVRHRLSPIEVAAVLGVPFEAARTLLAAAETEVGRTRAALLVLGVGTCPELDRLGGAGAESWRDWVLGPALRRELVRHVVDCPTCRGTSERVAGQVGEGLATLPGLPMLSAPAAVPEVPGTAAGAAERVRYLPGPPVARRGGGPVPVTEPGLRFDQRGFPRHRAPDSGRGTAVRQRVVTTGVLAAVLAAPVVALWAGHRDGGDAGAAAAVSSVRVEDGRPPQGRPSVGGPTAPGAGTVGQPGGSAPTTAGLMLAGAGALAAETLFPGLHAPGIHAPGIHGPGFHGPGIQGPAVPVPGRGATPLSSPTLVAAPVPVVGPGPGSGGRPAPVPGGLLTVEAGEYGNRTVLTLTNSGTTDIHWHAEVDAAWLRLSRDSGTLLPGQRITVTVTVDEELAPDAHWTARIALPPSHAVVTLEGGPQHRGGGTPPASPPASPSDPTPDPTPGSTPPGPGPGTTPTGGPPPGGTTGGGAEGGTGGGGTGTPGSPAPTSSASPSSPPPASAPATAGPAPSGGPTSATPGGATPAGTGAQRAGGDGDGRGAHR